MNLSGVLCGQLQVHNMSNYLKLSNFFQRVDNQKIGQENETRMRRKMLFFQKNYTKKSTRMMWHWVGKYSWTLSLSQNLSPFTYFSLLFTPNFVSLLFTQTFSLSHLRLFFSPTKLSLCNSHPIRVRQRAEFLIITYFDKFNPVMKKSRILTIGLDLSKSNSKIIIQW